MGVERDDRRRVLLARDRCDDLLLEVLVALGLGQQLSATAEERVRSDEAAGFNAERPGERLDAGKPGLEPGGNRGAIGGPHVLVYSKELHPGRIVRRLMTEAVRYDIDETTLGGQRAVEGGIHRIAGRGCEHHLGGCERLAPIATLFNGPHQLSMRVVLATENVNRACEMRKRREEPAMCEICSVANRRKTHRFGA